MKIYRAKRSFETSYIDREGLVLKGQTFIVESEKDLPESDYGFPISETFQQIVPKNLLIKLDSFVKAVDL